MRIKGKLIVLFAALSLCFGVTAKAAENKIITSDCSAKAGHYIDVEVRLKADAALSTGSFTLEYDKSHAEIKNIKNVFSDITLRSADSGGKTEITLVCNNAVNLSDGAKLFAVRYKKTDEADFSIKINAGDCVDDSGKRIEGINSAVCKVTAYGGSRTSSKSYSKSYYAKSSKTSSNTNSLVVSSVDVIDEDEPDSPNEVKVKGEGNNFTDYLPLILTVLLFVLLCFIFLQNSVSRKKKKASLEERLEKLEKLNEEHGER